MKSKFNLFFLLASFLFACACKSPLQDVKLVVNSKVFKTKIAFQIQDAVPTSPEPIPNITVKVFGGSDYSNPDNSIENPSYVLDSKGTKSFKVVKGFTTFFLSPGIEPNANKPVKFTAIFSAPGYLNAIVNVSLNKTGNSSYRVKMIKIDNTPAGVSAATGTMQVGTNGLGSNFTLTSNASGTQSFGATIFFTSGTRFYNSAGTELTGTLNVSIIHYNNQSESSLQSFPGGLDIHSGSYQGSQINNFTFLTAGLVDFQITAGNQNVASFSNPAILTMGIDPNTYNPDNQSMVSAGQSIPVWTMNQSNGVWNFLSNSTIESGTNGLQSVSNLNSPGIVNYDYRVNNNGIANPQLGIGGNSLGDFPPSGYLNFRLYFANTNTYYGNEQWFSIDEIRNGSNFSYPILPSDIQFVLRAFYGNQLVGESSPFSSSIGTIYMNYNFSGFNFINYFRVEANVWGTCPNQPDVRNTPDAAVYIRDVNGYYENFGWMSDGFYTGYFQSGRTYNYCVFAYGQLSEGSFTIESGFSGTLYYENNVELSPEACEDLGL